MYLLGVPKNKNYGTCLWNFPVGGNAQKKSYKRDKVDLLNTIWTENHEFYLNLHVLRIYYKHFFLW